MSIIVGLQYAVPRIGIPSRADFQRWAEASLTSRYDTAEVAIRVAGEDEVAALNQRYRSKQGATNVLSFPFEARVPLAIPFLGDVVICAPLVAREALEQAKDERAHWAHLVVHGILHLLGFDHQQEAQAKQMETLETSLLTSLGYSDPYESESIQ